MSGKVLHVIRSALVVIKALNMFVTVAQLYKTVLVQHHRDYLLAER